MGRRDRLHKQAVVEGKEPPILHNKEYIPTKMVTPSEGIGRKLRRADERKRS